MKTDLIVGTPTYMSPEQAIGRPANELSDQYSIGALLYRCLTGRPPQGVLPRPRELRPEIPERLEAVILRALEATPEKRFATVHELGHGLLSFASLAARGRWRSYYRTPPLPVDQTTTGSFPLNPIRPSGAAIAAEPGSEPSAPPTVAAQYDFKAHDRTTTLDPDGQRGLVFGAANPTKSAASDVEPFPLTPASASDAPTTLDVRVSEASALSGGGERAVSDARGRAVSASAVSRVRGRRRFVAAFGSIAVVVLTVTAVGIRSTRHRHSPAPAAPEWTRTAVPVAPAPAASVAPAPSPPVSPPSRAPAAHAPRLAEGVQQVPSTTAATPPEPAPVPSPAPVHRWKHRRQPTPGTETIQYGADGLPILH